MKMIHPEDRLAAYSLVKAFVIVYPRCVKIPSYQLVTKEILW